MTEDEMKAKVCIKLLQAAIGNVHEPQTLGKIVSLALEKGECNCIGSDCAMWVEVRADWRHPESGEVIPEAGEVIGGRCGLVR